MEILKLYVIIAPNKVAVLCAVGLTVKSKLILLVLIRVQKSLIFLPVDVCGYVKLIQYLTV